jgi:putative transposase
MSRKPRNQPEAEFHHITNQGARRSDIYLDAHDRAVFTELLAKAHSKYGVLFHASCLMGNHYHLLAQFPDRNMSQVMHWIGMCYSQQINRRYDYTGRLCKDRFFNSPVDNDDYLIAAVRYIHRNPKDFHIPVQELAYYTSSSYGVYLGLRARPEWLRTDLTLELFSNNIEAFRRFTEDSVPSDFAAKLTG